MRPTMHIKKKNNNNVYHIVLKYYRTKKKEIKASKEPRSMNEKHT
jgi:hypothetical protein